MADVYCPRCFELVEDLRVFCETCGQFIHENAPADSREWDSRPPDVFQVAPVAAEAPVVINLPDQYMPDAEPDAEPDPAPNEESGSEAAT